MCTPVSVAHMKDKVVAIQVREHLHDGQMAALLGVSRPTWNRIRNGHLRFGDHLAVRAAGLWPELTRDLLDRAAAVSVGTEQGHPNGNIPASGVASVLQDGTEAA